MLQTSLKSLKNLKPGILENTPFKELDLRNQTINSLNYVFGMNDIPAEPMNVLKTNLEQALAWTQASPYFMSLTEEGKTQVLNDLQKKQTDLINSVSGSDDKAVLALSRARVLALLKFDESDPYYFSSAENIDAEKYSINLLKSVAISKTQGQLKRSLKERLAATSSLASFQSLESASDAINELKESLQKELALASDSTERNNIRKLLSLLK